jgi:hypothetical protein
MSALYRSVILLCCIIAAGPAAADQLDNTGVFRGADTQFKLGYVAGIATTLMDGPINAQVLAGYRRCLSGQTNASLLRIVDAYIDRTPTTNTDTPDVTIMMALYEMCLKFLPPPQSRH